MDPAQSESTASEADAAPPVDQAAEQEPADHWLKEIDGALARESSWRTAGRKLNDRYRADPKAEGSKGQGLNILWANTEILKAALYGRTAKPDVRRRFTDALPDQKVARVVADALERAVVYLTDCYDPDPALEGAVTDMLLPGRGTVWATYDPEIVTEQDELGQPSERVGDQPVWLDFVYWEDFCHGVARQFGKVPWVARLIPMRREDMQDRWAEAASTVSYSYRLKSAEGDAKGSGDDEGFAEVWEIWDRQSRTRKYVCRGYQFVLQSDEDPLGLRDFFPCPEPVYSFTTTNTLEPVPEFREYQPQADELDTTCERINRLIEALKWNGVYDASSEDSDQLANLADLADGQFLPHKAFRQILEKGGIEAAFGFRPIDKIHPVVMRLSEHRQSLIQQIFELTGISDIIRGSSDPRETKGAQQIKAQFGSMRIQKRQRAVQKFVRNAYRIMVEIVAEHWTRDMFARATGYNFPTKYERQGLAMQAQQMQAAGIEIPPAIAGRLKLPDWEDVAVVLRSDQRRAFAVDVETDSTVFEDAQAAQQQRIEFMGALDGMLEKAYQAATQAPMLLPLIRESVLFGVRSFKVGRSMEDAIEEAFDQLEAMGKQQGQGGGQQPDVDPVKMADVKRQAEKDKGDLEIGREKVKTDKARAAAGIFEAMAKLQPRPEPERMQ